MSEYFDHFRIVITDGDRQWVKKVSAHDFFFGRMAPCDLILEASFISRRHGRIFIEEGNLWIEDLKSSNGVFVNGLKIRAAEKTPLPTQSVITFGENHKLSLMIEVVLASESDDVRITGSGNPTDLKEQASRALHKFNNVMSDGLQLIRMKIENKEKMIEHVKQESMEIIKTTREEREALIEKAKQEAKKIVVEAQVIAEKTVKEAEAKAAAQLKELETQLSDQRKDAEKELKKHRENLESHQASLERLQKEVEDFTAQSAKAREDLTDVQVKVKEKEQLDQDISELKKSIGTEKDLLARVEGEVKLVEQRRKELHEENIKLAVVPQQIQKEVESLQKEQARLEDQVAKATDEKNHIQKFVDELIGQRKDLKGQIDEEKQQARTEREAFQKELEDHKKNLLEETRVKCDQMVSEAEMKSQDLLREARLRASEESERQTRAAEAEVEKIRSQLEGLRSEMVSLEEKLKSRERDFEAELSERREKAMKALDNELLEKKARGLQSVEVDSKSQEARYKEYMKSEALNVQNRLIEAAATRMSGLLRSDLNAEDKARLDHVLRKATESVLLGVDFDEKELEAHLKARPVEQQKKNKRFFAMMISGTAIFAIIMFSMPAIMKQFEHTAREVASAAKERDQENIKQMEEQREILTRFEPEQVDEYKDNYTDRVLYTRGYVERELNPQFREKWILELNDHLLRELKMNEDVVVAFIAKEANLIRELQSTKGNINGQYAEEGIQRMREIEKIFVDNVQKLAGSKKNLTKILEYKKDFYLR